MLLSRKVNRREPYRIPLVHYFRLFASSDKAIGKKKHKSNFIGIFFSFHLHKNDLTEFVPTNQFIYATFPVLSTLATIISVKYASKRVFTPAKYRGRPH